MIKLDLSKKKKIGLVCSGGAVKAAAFHCGVALALEHAGFRFLGGRLEGAAERGQVDASKLIQCYVGSSAGSLIATFLAQGGMLANLIASFQEEKSTQGIPGLRYSEMLKPRLKVRDWISIDNYLLSMLRNASLQSPFTTHGIADYIRTHVLATERFQELEPELFVVATELNQSKKVVFGKYKSAPQDPYLEYRSDVSVSDACAASMSLPPLFHPYTIQIDGQKRDFYDGEIREPLSNHIARDIGCDLIICSYTHQPLRLTGDNQTLADKGVHQVTLQAIYQSIEEKIRSARGTRDREKALLDIIRKFFIEKGLSNEMRDELVAMVEERMTYKENVDYIYIHPKPSDLEMFMMPHFSLKRNHTEGIVKRGFSAGKFALKGFTEESKDRSAI